MDYILERKAIVALRKLPVADRRKVMRKLDFFFRSNDPLEFARPLHGEFAGCFRLRVGDIRVVFDVYAGVARVLLVGERKDIYR